jgi:beta-phosphoglucomutase-like phosphatase (HAD superfamily)
MIGANYASLCEEVRILPGALPDTSGDRLVAYFSAGSNRVGSDAAQGHRGESLDMPTAAMREVAGPPPRLGRARIGTVARDSAEDYAGARSPRLASRRVSPQRLRAGWRAAFDAADDALRAAGGFLSANELGVLRSRLAAERASTVGLLQAYALTEGGPSFEHLELQPWEAQSLLGLPSQVHACVFNLDGVLIGSAELHAEAWRQTFNGFLATRRERSGAILVPFDVRTDYPRHIHGRPRLDGVREFLASRGISLPEGDADDPPGDATVRGLANGKKKLFVSLLEQRGVMAFAGARDYLESARDAHIGRAVVSASANAHATLDRAGLSSLVDVTVDGNVIAAEHLAPRPAPDILLAAARRLDVELGRTAIFETTPAGIAAARSGRFGVVVGVGRGDQAHELRASGADLVVAGLEELFTERHAA